MKQLNTLNTVARAYAVMLAYTLLMTGNLRDLDSYTGDCAFEELERQNGALASYLCITAPHLLRRGTEEEKKQVREKLTRMIE